jgi:hypothetical protein
MSDPWTPEGAMDSSKEFEEALETAHAQWQPIANGSGSLTNEQLWELEKADVLEAHHKATQARVREVLERLKALPDVPMHESQPHVKAIFKSAIDAELSKLGEQEND